jgi:hypothetical protein
MAKKLEKLKKGSEFVHYAEHHPATRSTRQCGSHVTVHTDKGMAVVPNHNKDLGTGLRSKLLKTFVIIGLGIWILSILV